MKYLKQFTIIMIFTFVGDLLSRWTRLPIPASIWGLVLLFAALCTRLVDLSEILETGEFLLAIMPIMFIAPAVNILDLWDEIVENFLSIITIMTVSTVIVFAVAGGVTQWIERRRK